MLGCRDAWGGALGTYEYVLHSFSAGLRATGAPPKHLDDETTNIYIKAGKPGKAGKAGQADKQGRGRGLWAWQPH